MPLLNDKETSRLLRGTHFRGSIYIEESNHPLPFLGNGEQLHIFYDQHHVGSLIRSPFSAINLRDYQVITCFLFLRKSGVLTVFKLSLSNDLTTALLLARRRLYALFTLSYTSTENLI